MVEKTANRRFRNYACVVYPDSAPENWQEILTNQLVPSFISPLHDLDFNPDGEVKKPHFHVLIVYDAPKSTDQAQDVFTAISGVGCEVVQSLRGYARYLCHLDNPEKHQYNPEAVRALCGADYNTAVSLPTDKYKAIQEMIEYVRENGIYSYSDLLDYCSVERFDWFRVLCDNGTVVMKEYLKSRLWTAEIEKRRNQDA